MTSEQLARELASRSSALVGIESSIMCLVNVTAILGNLSVCYATYRNQRLRTLSNMFIVALAIADIVMVSLCTPFTVATLVAGRWLFGNMWCEFHGFFAFTSGLVSLLTRGLISLSRYFCIVKNIKYQALFTKKSTLLYIVLVWVIALFDSVPPLFVSSDGTGYTFQPGKSMCLFTFESNLGYTIFTEIVFIGLPLVLIVICYSRVFLSVYKSNRVFAFAGNVESLRAHVAEVKISKTLAVVVAGFAICWIPISAMDTIDAMKGTLTLSRRKYLAYSFLAYGSCTLNPVIYGVMSKTFRREYVRIVQGIFRLQRSPRPPRGHSLHNLESFRFRRVSNKEMACLQVPRT